MVVAIGVRRRVICAVQLGKVGGQHGRNAHAKALLAWRANVVDGAGTGGAADADAVGEADGRAVRRLDGADDQCAHVMLQVALLLTVTVMPSPMVRGPVLAAL